MAITAAERQDIIELIVLMFDAAPGGIYLPDVIEVHEAGRGSIAALADALDGTALFQSLYRDASEDDIARFLTPLKLQDDPGAVQWMGDLMAAGVSLGGIMAAAWDYLDDLPDSAPAQYVRARDIMHNKRTVAEYYSVDEPVMSTDYAELHALLIGVDEEWRG